MKESICVKCKSPFFATISKKWNKPEFSYYVTEKEMEVTMSLEDFKIALKQEIGSITWTFKKETFEKQLDEAIQRVISGVKEESAKVV